MYPDCSYNRRLDNRGENLMSKATLDKLNALHGAVADVLAEGLEACAPAATEDDDGEFKLIGYDARLVGQAMTFLKDNDITVDLDTGADISETQKRLAEIRKKSRTREDPFPDIMQ